MNHDNHAHGLVAIYLRKLELYFETHSALHIITSIIAGGVAFLSSVLGILQVLGPTWSERHSIIFLMFAVILLLALDYKHVRLLDGRMNELLKRDLHIKSLKAAMAFQTDRIEVPYTNEKMSWVYDIQSDGSANCTWESVISSDGQSVYLTTIQIGWTSNVPAVSSEEEIGLIVSRRDDQNRMIPLLNYLILDEPRAKRYCIVLDAPVQGENKATLVAQYKSPKAWIDLLNRSRDIGSLLVRHRARKVELKIVAPINYEFTAFAHNPSIGQYSVSTTPEGRSELDWEANNIEKQTKVSYEIFARKVH